MSELAGTIDTEFDFAGRMIHEHRRSIVQPADSDTVQPQSGGRRQPNEMRFAEEKDASLTRRNGGKGRESTAALNSFALSMYEARCDTASKPEHGAKQCDAGLSRV